VVSGRTLALRNCNAANTARLLLIMCVGAAHLSKWSGPITIPETRAARLAEGTSVVHCLPCVFALATLVVVFS
jgi:hypothetical protein